MEDLEGIVQRGWGTTEEEGNSCTITTVYTDADGEISVSLSTKGD
jgi:hypothetical protein